MGTLEAGDRVKIVAFGPRDSWTRAIEAGDPSPLGLVGTLVHVEEQGSFATRGYTTCMIHLDEPLLGYLVRLTLFEAKLEKLMEG
mgnify:CR=1 FL=1